MLRTVLTLLLALCVPSAAAAATAAAPDDAPQTTPEQATRIHAGDEAPGFSLELVDGTRFDLAAQRGKVVLVNFWATWCPPCVAEMPHLRDEILGQYPDEDFVVVCVSREETNQKIAAFAEENRVSALPMGGDLDRSIYAQYAEHTIPRNFLVGRYGKVLFESIGFEPEDFEALKVAIAGAVEAPAR